MENNAKCSVYILDTAKNFGMSFIIPQVCKTNVLKRLAYLINLRHVARLFVVSIKKKQKKADISCKNLEQHILFGIKILSDSINYTPEAGKRKHQPKCREKKKKECKDKNICE